MPRLLVVAAILSVGCSAPAPAPQGGPAPCAQLSAICAYCSQAGPKEQCNQAVAVGDDGQCAAVFDQVQPDCVPPDGGPDGAASDAARLPPCGTQLAEASACACAAGTCAPACPGGGCAVTCGAGATCQGTCAGGSCRFDCKAGSTCDNTCSGGGCSFQCEDMAVCNDVCALDAGCVGP
ncbi:MAG TPA: hypothetical protein VKT18_04735 [Acidimicrobiales bacterium]|nr:hypothetical protein [Acidimicrobiales bacterium]